MNYLEQIILFEEYAEMHKIPVYSQMLWFQLMRVNNTLAWANEFTIDNLRLVQMTGFGSERSVIKHRKYLVDEGIIVFRRGKKGKPSTYEMQEFYRDDEVIKIRPRTGESVQETMTEIVSEKKQAPKKKPKAKKKEDTQKYLDVMEFYMEHRRNMKSIQFKDGPIKTRIKALKKLERAGFSLDDARDAILKAEQSDFLNGLTGNDWVAGFDWIIKPDKITKILEGTYENRQGQKTPSGDDYLFAVGSGQINIDGSINQDEFTDFVIDNEFYLDDIEEYIS